MKSSIIYGPLFGLVTLGLSAPVFAQSQQFRPIRSARKPMETFVMSTGQIVAPAGKTVILGSPVRGKAVALNPANPNFAAVLTMGAAQAVEIINLAAARSSSFIRVR